ncbi:MAG TPA: inositol monophosphatase family protein [Arenicellales bacterium]|nr:inositol monophosphatase family protein [Arenicellales bacterium]
MLNTAVKAARRAGRIIIRSFDRGDTLSIDRKGFNDFVSEVDRAAEEEIIEVLQHAYPGHAILAEESGGQGGGDYQWVIDPLDGTTNFLHGFPQFAVSIGLLHKGRLDQAVVFDPLRDELFTASAGAGAHLNNRRIRVSRTRKLDQSLIGTGFPFRSMEHLDKSLNTMKELLPRTSGIRRPGAAALDLAYVACGRFDGFWETGLKPWDMAAGCLLIREAGGLVSEPDNGGRYLESGNVVAGNPHIQPLLLAVVRKHYS